MDAIQYLRDQHYEIESLFDQIDSALRACTRSRLRRRLADLLAVHAVVEETIFYPAVQDALRDELLLRAIVEHLSTERIAADLLDGDEAGAPARTAALRRHKQRHADLEERVLFPRACERLTCDDLERLGERMAQLADRLMEPGLGARERLAPRRALA